MFHWVFKFYKCTVVTSACVFVASANVHYNVKSASSSTKKLNLVQYQYAKNYLQLNRMSISITLWIVYTVYQPEMVNRTFLSVVYCLIVTLNLHYFHFMVHVIYSVQCVTLFMLIFLQSWEVEPDQIREKLLNLIGRIGKEARITRTTIKVLLFCPIVEKTS